MPHSNTPDPVKGEEGKHRLAQQIVLVHHAKPGTKDGNDSQLFTGDLLCRGAGNGGMDLHVFQGEIPRDLIPHQHRDLVKQLAKILGGGVDLSHNGQLVLNERVVDQVKCAHISSLSRALCPATSFLLLLYRNVALFARGNEGFFLKVEGVCFFFCLRKMNICIKIYILLVKKNPFSEKENINI